MLSSSTDVRVYKQQLHRPHAIWFSISLAETVIIWDIETRTCLATIPQPFHNLETMRNWTPLDAFTWQGDIQSMFAAHGSSVTVCSPITVHLFGRHLPFSHLFVIVCPSVTTSRCRFMNACDDDPALIATLCRTHDQKACSISHGSFQFFSFVFVYGKDTRPLHTQTKNSAAQKHVQ